MSDPTQQPPDLEQRMNDAATRYAITAGDHAAVVALATRRAARRRRFSVAFAVVALVATTAGVVRATGNDDRETSVGATGTSSGTLDVTWTRVDPRSALGPYRSLSTGRALYALSTAPGERYSAEQRELSRVIWRSEDGIDWEYASKLGNDLYLADLSGGDDRVYAVGTAPAAAFVAGGVPVSPLVVGWSDDRAKQWQHKRLPLDWEALSTKAKTTVASANVVSGARGTVAAAVLTAELRMQQLLPSGVSAPHGWALTDAGVDLLGPARADVCPEGTLNSIPPMADGRVGEVSGTWCAFPERKGAEKLLRPQEAHPILRSLSWDELGVDGDLRTAARRGLVAFYAPPGSTDFARVELPPMSNVMSIAIEASDGGFTLFALTRAERYGDQPARLAIASSPDGRTWTRQNAPAEAEWTVDAGSLRGRGAFISNSEAGSSLFTSDGAGAWTKHALASVLPPDFTDNRDAFASAAAFGEFGAAMAVVSSPRGPQEERSARQAILLTPDGRTWETVSVEELTGNERSIVSRISIVGNSVIVATSLPPEDPNKPDVRKQVIYVGSVRS